MNTKTLKEQLDIFDAEVDQEENLIYNNQAQVALFSSPKFKMILAILNEQPILVAPVLKWLQEKRAALAMAQLKALYTTEELEEMFKQVQK